MMKITNKREYLPLVNKYSVKTIDDMILTPVIIKYLIYSIHKDFNFFLCSKKVLL